MWFKKNKNQTQSLYSQWVIQPNLPWYKRVPVVLSLTIAGCSILFTAIYLNNYVENTSYELGEVSSKYRRLMKKYIEMKSLNVKLQREIDIAQQSQVTIKDNLFDMHKQTQELTEQVDLYKRIISDGKPGTGLLVTNVKLQKAENEPSNYLLSLILLQPGKKKTFLQGALDIQVKGKIADKGYILDYSKLSIGKNASLSYKFRDFQQIHEKLALPPNFVAEKIIITTIDNKTKHANIKNITWLLTEGDLINVAKK